uniref:alpha-N-acetylgalactosaminide alpha-2,6-sialyltransferase n=1 Tax=Cyprinus carpio TaxID=7962 RepID=A0A8C1Q1N9_CYPCA
MDGTSYLFWPAILFTLLAIIVAAVFMGRNKAPAPSKCSHQTSAVMEERAGPDPGVSTHYHEKQNNESNQHVIPPKSNAKSLKAKGETKLVKDSNSDNVEKVCKSDSPVHTSTGWGEDFSESGIRNALRNYAQSPVDAEKKPLRYMAGMLRTCQLEKMMSREELEEEQRVQREQLAAIFQLLREKQDTFGEKNFTKLPVWDFEEVYLRNNEARKPTCPNSLQNTEDPEFKEAVLPDVQLWLYKGLLNITEWNRLAHFNNPFGFMEYKYNEVKRAVDLIPKPKSSILLPVPESSKDGCIRCAVVGSGGILNNSKMGKEIDSHEYVFRVNGAVTQGFEEDVGNRTSVYVHTAFSLYSNILSLKKYGFNSIPQDEGIKYVMIPEGLRDFEWIQGLLQGKEANGSFKGVRPLKYFEGKFNESRFYVLHPDFLRYIRNRFIPSKQMQDIHWAMYRPTNGAFALFLALHTCDIVDAYGFITEDHHKYSNYYYEKFKKTHVIFYINHDYGLEIKTWKKLHDSGIIRLFQRH